MPIVDSGNGFDAYVPDPGVWMPVIAASREYGVPSQTLYQWVRRQRILATLGDYGNRENVWHVDIKQLEKIVEESDTYGKR